MLTYELSRTSDPDVAPVDHSELQSCVVGLLGSVKNIGATGLAAKVNQRSEIGRFGRIVRVGSTSHLWTP